MTLDTEVQRVSSAPGVPDNGSIQRWACAAYQACGGPGRAALELTVRIVDENEAAELNRRYRGGAGATNVLSFPATGEGPVNPGLLGDIVICAEVVAREAREQNKDLAAHWSHLVVHGVLHCCGYRHESEPDAERMELFERRVLAEFGFPDPYTVHDER